MIPTRIQAPLIALGIIAASASAADGLKWYEDYDAAVAAGLSARRPILVLFDAPASSARRKNLLPDLNASSDFLAFATAQKIVLANVGPPGISRDISVERHNRQLRANHGVQSLPAIVLLDADGRTLGSPMLRTNQSAADLVRSLRRLMPPSLLLQSTNAPPAASGALTIDLTPKATPAPSGAATLDLEKMRREGMPAHHPSVIDVGTGEVSGTNVINRRLPP